MLDVNRLDELKYAMELGATIPFDKEDGSFTLELYDQTWWCLRQEYREDNCILSSVDWEKFKTEVAEWMLSEDNRINLSGGTIYTSEDLNSIIVG